METLRAYYWLTKPGIIYGNLLAACAGFFIASRTAPGGVYWALLVKTAAAIALIIGSACVFNNYMDRDIDKKMKRTSWRALASDKIPAAHALVFASLLGIAGFAALAAFCNGLTFAIGVVAFIDYVAAYGWAKRHTWHGTLVGTVSGSAPLVAGYTTVTGRFDMGALLLLLMMTFWQMPHFYAIAIRRLNDYKAAGIPVLPAVKGVRAAKLQIIVYVAAFAITVVPLYTFGYAGHVYLAVIGVYALAWLVFALKGLGITSDAGVTSWARRMFLYSLIFLPALFLAGAADLWLG